MNYNKEAKSLTCRRGSEVSQVNPTASVRSRVISMVTNKPN